MHKVGSFIYQLKILEHKARKEKDFFIVFFPEIGEYYASNEVGVDIIDFFFQSEKEELFDFLSDYYGNLTATQRDSVLEYVEKLCSINIIEKRN